MIEVEFRARFSAEKYQELKQFLDINAKNLGQDDKDCVYYVFQDQLLKIVNNVSKGNAKISLKLNRIGEGAAFEEMEFHFDGNDFELAKQLFQHLPLAARTTQESQQRVNYIYKDCEIALKYSKSWGYHLEIEKVIENADLQGRAETEIRTVADELGIQLMTEDELKQLVKEHESKMA